MIACKIAISRLRDTSGRMQCGGKLSAEGFRALALLFVCQFILVLSPSNAFGQVILPVEITELDPPSSPFPSTNRSSDLQPRIRQSDPLRSSPTSQFPTLQAPAQAQPYPTQSQSKPDPSQSYAGRLSSEAPHPQPAAAETELLEPYWVFEGKKPAKSKEDRAMVAELPNLVMAHLKPIVLLAWSSSRYLLEPGANQ